MKSNDSFRMMEAASGQEKGEAEVVTDLKIIQPEWGGPAKDHW